MMAKNAKGKFAAARKDRRARVIAVGNQKGGVGKTSNTVHLATALAEAGRKCLVWDLDMNCGSTQHFGIPDNMAILGTYEVLMGEEHPDEVIVREGDLEEVELPKNLNLLPARRNLEFIDQALVGKYGKFSDISAVLKKPLDNEEVVAQVLDWYAKRDEGRADGRCRTRCSRDVFVRVTRRSGASPAIAPGCVDQLRPGATPKRATKAFSFSWHPSQPRPAAARAKVLPPSSKRA